MKRRMKCLVAMALGAGILMSIGNVNNGKIIVHAEDVKNIQTESNDARSEDGEIVESVQVGQVAYTLYENGRMHVSGTGTADIARLSEENRGNVNEIIFQKGITRIENNGNSDIDENGEWFYFYRNLKKVSLPDGLTEIANGVFAGTALKEIALPEGITKINYGTFRECKNLIEVSLPNSLREIAHAAFSECTSLKKIVIPDGVEKLGEEENEVEGVFYKCKNLSEVILPDSLQFIGCDAFSQCTSLSKIEIPDSVTHISEDVFSNSGLEGIKLSKNITEIRGGTFYWCRNLKRIEIPEGVTKIGSRAFYVTTSLEEVIIPETVKRIEYQAFDDSNLKSLVLPKGLEWLGGSVFQGNEELKEVIMQGNAPEYDFDNAWREEDGTKGGPFDYCSENLKIYVPENATGYDADPWTRYEIVYGEEYALGDINQDGNINMKDARTALKAAVGSETLDENQKKLGDVDGDGKVGMKDARLILKYAVGSITEF